LRFLAPVTVTTLCGSRTVPPFGAAGGKPGAVGENLCALARRTDWSGWTAMTNANLPAGSVFEMRTPGGGGWGAA
jgi:5-oxoprolinase (ATP-hydrolysing)